MSPINAAMSGMASAIAKLNYSASTVAAVSGASAVGGGTDSGATGSGSSVGPSAAGAYSQLQLSSTPAGFDFTDAMVGQADAMIQFQANLKLVQAGDEMFKTLNAVGAVNQTA